MPTTKRRLGFTLFAFTVASCGYQQQNTGPLAPTPPYLQSNVTVDQVKEVHGGDVTSLYFIKTGRFIAKQLAQNPDSLKSKFDGQLFLNAIESTLVDSTEDRRVFENYSTPVSLEVGAHGGVKIRINLMQWYMGRQVRCQDLLHLVMQTYLRVTLSESDEIMREFDQSSISQRCLLPLTAPARKTTTNFADGQSSLEGRLEEMSRLLEANSDWKVSQLVSTERIKVAISKVKFHSIYSLIDAGRLNGGYKSGINFFNGDQFNILVQPNWNLTVGEIYEFLLHEIAPVAGFDDSHYQVSSRFFLDADPQLYK